jgi:hypothetical protein
MGKDSSFFITPEILWANKEMAGIFLVILLFVSFIIGYKVSNQTERGIATITHVQSTGVNSPARYTLDVRPADGPPNISLFQTKIEPVLGSYKPLKGMKQGQEARVLYKKGPDGNWIIKEVLGRK